MEDVKVRFADSEEDLMEVAGLFLEIFPNSLMMIKEDDVYFIAEREEEAVGFGHVVEKEKYAMVKGLGVLESERGKGVGTKILEKMIKYCEEVGYEDIRLKVKVMNPAVKLYLKNGFYLKRIGTAYTLVRRKNT